MGNVFSEEQSNPTQQSTRREEESTSLSDSSLKFVDASDDHDFLCVGYPSRRARMSCGHTVTPQSLTDWCERQLQKGEDKLECGVCAAVWNFDEVRKMGLLTSDKEKTFNDKLFKNAFSNKHCPSCNFNVLRHNPYDLCVRCPQCSTPKKTYYFCWQCLRQWKGPYPRSDRCDNAGCEKSALLTLKACPEIEFKKVKGVKGCPSIRACPTWGKLLEHNRKLCKSVICPDCKVQFCFVCLKDKTECGMTSDYYNLCSSGVAPRQTSIPVKIYK